MASKDTKYTSLNETLSAAGKSVFVRFYYDFKDTSISQEILADKLFRENPATTSKRQGFRIPRARHIFETGQQQDALKIIIASKKVDEKIKILAKQILIKEEIGELAKKDVEDEEFLNKVNNAIVYGGDVSFEYDNSPKAPKQKTEQVSAKYVRSQKVARNALMVANNLCEYDNTHYVFTRRNSDKYYTEPHHIVPLSASLDFPNVDLDREQNVVSLCSNCHNILHYGADFEKILRPLYEKRKELLKAIGVEISYEELKKYY